MDTIITLKNGVINMNKRILIGFIFGSLIFSSACGVKSSENNKPSNIGTGQTQNSSKPMATTPRIVQDAALTKKVLKEKHVVAGQIYVRDKMVIGAIVMDKSSTKAYAKEIGTKYMKEIKTKYKNMKANIQIISNGKSLINLKN